MNAERDHVMAAQHRAIAALQRDSAAPLVGYIADNCRKEADCHDRLAELLDPPDAEVRSFHDIQAENQKLKAELASYGASPVATAKEPPTGPGHPNLWAHYQAGANTILVLYGKLREAEEENDNAESRVAGQTCRAEASEEENQKLRGELQTANGRVSKYIDRAAERATDNGHLKSALDQAVDTIHGFARKEHEAAELGAARYFVWESGAVSVFPAKNTGGVYFPRHIHYVDEWRIDSNDVARCEKYAEETDLAGAEKALEGHPKSLAELHRLAGTETEAPEPAGLGELLDALEDAVGLRNAGLNCHDSHAIEEGRELVKTAREAIVAYVARQANTTDPGEKAALMAYSKLANWLNDNHEPVIRETGAGDTYADIAIRLMEKSGDVAVEYIEEPEREPGGTWCKLHDRGTAPGSVPCDERRHQERLPRQKTNSHAGWGKGVICRCEHCPEFRTEPAADAEAGMRAMGFEEVPESDRAMSPEMTKVFEPVERLRGLADHGANCKQLAKAIIELEGNQRPPAVTLDTSLQAAILALPVTLRADATDMARVAAAAGEAVLGCRLLVSVRDEVIDRDATCGECSLLGYNDCMYDYTPDATCVACMKIARKPETSEETKPAKAKLEELIGGSDA